MMDSKQEQKSYIHYLTSQDKSSLQQLYSQGKRI